MKKILIVEDEPDIQELLRTYLEDAGYETAMAGDGVAALDLFGAQPLIWCCWTCCCQRSTVSACVN